MGSAVETAGRRMSVPVKFDDRRFARMAVLAERAGLRVEELVEAGVETALGRRVPVKHVPDELADFLASVPPNVRESESFRVTRFESARREYDRVTEELRIALRDRNWILLELGVSRAIRERKAA